jgi:DNA polymerase III alpha subunit
MIQLRVRTEFSFKTAFGPIKRVAQSLKGTPYAAIVDGDTWGHVKWAAACKEAGIVPLFGTELVVPQADGRRPTCWVLAEDTKALYRLSSAARVEGADVLDLLRKAQGVIRFAGAALTDPSTFDFVDINPASRIGQQAAIQLSKATGRPLVVTSDNYYPSPADRSAFLAMGGRERNTPQHIIQSEKELAAAIPGLERSRSSRAALAWSAIIAKRCATKLPTAPLIKVEGDIRKVAEAGRKMRLKKGHLSKWTKVYADRLRARARGD